LLALDKISFPSFEDYGVYISWLTDKSFDELYTRPKLKLGANSSSRLKLTETFANSPLKRTFAISLGFKSKAEFWTLRVLSVNQIHISRQNAKSRLIPRASSFKRGTLNSVPPFSRGVRGGSKCSAVTLKDLCIHSSFGEIKKRATLSRIGITATLSKILKSTTPSPHRNQFNLSPAKGY